jgi:hypothetical protein
VFPRVPCNDGYAQTAPAGSFEANGFGLSDKLGNAWSTPRIATTRVTRERPPTARRGQKEINGFIAAVRGTSFVEPARRQTRPRQHSRRPRFRYRLPSCADAYRALILARTHCRTLLPARPGLSLPASTHAARLRSGGPCSSAWPTLFRSASVLGVGGQKFARPIARSIAPAKIVKFPKLAPEILEPIRR